MSTLIPSTPDDALVSQGWSPEVRKLGWWEESYAAEAAAIGMAVVTAVMAARPEELPPSVNELVTKLERLEEAYALRQPQLWPEGPPATAQEK